MKRIEIVRRMMELEQKYFDLVWLARKPVDAVADGHPSMKGVVRVRMKWPKEVEDLEKDKTGWTHGFNSGCLAAFRLALGLMGDSYEVEFAEDNFPNLDS